MSDPITEYVDYDAFARDWHGDALRERDLSLETAREEGLLDERDTRRLWHLLGLLHADQVVLDLPEWLAEQSTPDAELETPEDARATPTTFVGRIRRETDDAILVEESAPVSSLLRVAHRIDSLERGLENTPQDSNRREDLEERLRAECRAFERREGRIGIDDEWLPKSQLIAVVRRSDDESGAEGPTDEDADR